MEEATKGIACVSTIFAEEVLYMNLPIEPMLYIDIQREQPVSFCPVCGGERYVPGEHCLRCERRLP